MPQTPLTRPTHGSRPVPGPVAGPAGGPGPRRGRGWADGPGRDRGWGTRPGALAVLLAAVLVAACGGSDPVTTASPSDPGDLMVDEGEVDATSGPTAAPPASSAPPDLHPSVDDYPAAEVVVDPGDGAAPVTVAVRVADTPERRAHGLMEVEEVPEDVGMWFVYDEDHEGAFWMKDVLVDLDIAWVADNGRVVALETMAPCESEPCERYDPGTSYRTALEMRAGWFADHGVEVGDRILRGRVGQS